MHEVTIDDVATAIAFYCDREPTHDGISICRPASRLADILGTLICSGERIVPAGLLSDEIRGLLDAALASAKPTCERTQT